MIDLGIARFSLRKLRYIKRRLDTSESVVVAGLGRCGTTLLYNALREHGYCAPDNSFLVDFAVLSDAPTGSVYKTHAYPPASLPRNMKLIWLFGDPRNIALSVHNKMNEWGRRHHAHLQSSGYEPNTSVLRRDTLGLGEHFEAWYRRQNFPFVSVRYERLRADEVQDALASFLVFRVDLPRREERKAHWDQSGFVDTLNAVYGSLAERIESAENIRIWDD
jgi:hypothetical protein